MNTLFISDIHLSEQQPEITKHFLDFLKDHAGKIDALYIVGDLFEVWIGDDHDTPFNRTIISGLNAFTTSKVPTYFLHGNRDFLIGERFAHQTGVKLLPDPSVIDLYGKLTLLTHGDMLCTLDIRHQRHRKVLRNPHFHKIFLKLPLKWRQKVANRLRDKSQKYISQLDLKMMDVPEEKIPPFMEEHHVKQLIYGHTHQPSIRTFPSNDGEYHCYVLSDWSKQKGNMLQCDRNGKFEMIYFS